MENYEGHEHLNPQPKWELPDIIGTLLITAVVIWGVWFLSVT